MRFIYHHFVFVNDERVGCAKINGYVLREKIKEAHSGCELQVKSSSYRFWDTKTYRESKEILWVPGWVSCFL